MSKQTITAWSERLARAGGLRGALDVDEGGPGDAQVPDRRDCAASSAGTPQGENITYRATA